MSISPFFVDDLIAGLERLPEVRRKACLYALEGGMEPSQVAELTWRNFMGERHELTPLMAEIVASQVRHIRLSYLFWELHSPHVVAPLLQLQASIESAFRMPWGQLQQAYASMVMIDRRSDVTHFESLIGDFTADGMGRLT